jgi:enoyl-CoA hydratase/carnithine racemase
MGLILMSSDCERRKPMKHKTILFRKENGLAFITLHQPETMNALSGQMMDELRAALHHIDRDTKIRVVLLSGGDHCFAAGFDIREIENIATPVDARCYLKKAHALFDSLEGLEKPVIAVIAGLALSGGFELALACDLRVAAENATFGQPEIKIGMIPGGGGTQRLPRVIGMTKAKELLYTGDHINAQEAYRLGLLNRVVAPDLLMQEARVLALRIAAQPQEALKAVKLAVNGGRDMAIPLALAYEARCLEQLFATEDQKEGVIAYMEKRMPVFKNR